MILIYSKITTERLKYTLTFIFESVLGTKFEITNDISYFENSNFPKINYSNDKRINCIEIQPNNILFEENINEIHKIEFDEKKDIFGNVFFLISRYEEYLSYEKDIHSRFLYKNSVIKNVEIAVVNEWIETLKSQLTEKWNGILFKDIKYQFIATYDIDQIYSYKGKGVILNLIGMVRSIKTISNRLKVLFLNLKDPYDTFDLFLTQNKSNSKTSIFFFLAAQKRGSFDKNSSPTSLLYKNTVSKIEQLSEIGIHPSYESNFKDTLPNELNVLNQLLNTKITKSRQHYLKLEFPKTYQNLIKNGLKEDYSLGYPEQLGFRSGTCFPHYFFDLSTNKTTELLLYPLNIMDTTFIEYLKIDPKTALQKGKQLIDEIKKYNGTFTMLWHNSTFAETNCRREWENVYKNLMSYAKE